MAQQQISGAQSGTLGPGSYTVVGNITVDAGKKLTVAPGTKFSHSGAYSWAISGQLSAVGEAGKKIEFIRSGTTQWGGIKFLQGSSNESILDYCVIDNCYSSQSGAGISVTGVPVTIRNSTISNCKTGGYGAGINAYNSSLTISNCIIESNNCPANGGSAINLDDCNKATVQYCTIRKNINSPT